MSIYDQLIQEGIEKGIEKGKIEVVRNLLGSGKFTVPEIANFTSVSEETVLRISKEQ